MSNDSILSRTAFSNASLTKRIFRNHPWHYLWRYRLHKLVKKFHFN